jgi:hypothetical protein
MIDRRDPHRVCSSVFPTSVSESATGTNGALGGKISAMEDLPSHGDRQQVVARLSAESRATPGGEVELSLDTSQIHPFAADSGRSLTATAA